MSYMIDWLTIRLEVIHSTINGGKVVHFDPMGQVDYTFEKRFTIEGSYSSKLQIRSEIDLECINDLEIRSRFIWLSGNFAKFMQGHNVWGSACGKEQLEQVIRYLIKTGILKLPSVEAGYNSVCPVPFELQCYKRIRAGEFEMFRIDINTMLSFVTKADALEYLEILADTTRTKRRNADRKKGTIYWNFGSSHWSMKAYHKHTEITRRGKKHKLTDKLTPLQKDYIIASCENWLRLEVQINSRKLKEMYLQINQDFGEIDSQDRHVMPAIKYYQFEQIANVGEIFENFREKIQMTEKIETSNEKAMQLLSSKAYMTFNMWSSGREPHLHLAQATFYRHRKEIREKMGLDINLPFKGFQKHDNTVVRVITATPVNTSVIIENYSQIETVLRFVA